MQDPPSNASLSSRVLPLFRSCFALPWQHLLLPISTSISVSTERTEQIGTGRWHFLCFDFKMPSEELLHQHHGELLHLNQTQEGRRDQETPGAWTFLDSKRNYSVILPQTDSWCQETHLVQHFILSEPFKDNQKLRTFLGKLFFIKLSTVRYN